MSTYLDNLEKQADVMFARVGRWEINALRRIGSRVKKIGSLSHADLQAINNAAIANQDVEAVMKELAELTGQNVREVQQMYDNMIATMHEDKKVWYDYRKKPFVPFADNKELQAITRAFARTTAETFVNLSMTKANRIGFVDKTGKFKPIDKAFKEVIDKAVMSVSTGTGDYNSEMLDVLRQLGGSGVRVDYGNDITRSLDSMVRQNVLWGAKQTAKEYEHIIGDELGCDGIEIDWHSNPRPDHEFMQGKQFILGRARTVNGIYFESADKAREALDDWGCLHFETRIICGVSEPAYSPEELRRLNAENNRLIEIDGVSKKGYEWKQTMRRLERAGKETKLKMETFKAAGNNTEARNQNIRLKAIEEKYQFIADKTGIKAQYERMAIVKGKSVDNSAKSGIIKINSAEYMRAQFPKGFRDETNPGKAITADNLEHFYNKATEYGVRFDERLGKYGGFETYRGDVDVLDDALERIKTNRDEMQKYLKDDTVLLKYDDIKDDNGAIDIETFAMVNGHTITINKFMYDDTKYLKRQYADSVTRGMFTEGTDYRNIIDHEMGHIFNYENPRIIKKLRKSIRVKAANSSISYEEFVGMRISTQALYKDEIIAELNAMRKGTNSDMAMSIWKEATKNESL